MPAETVKVAKDRFLEEAFNNNSLFESGATALIFQPFVNWERNTGMIYSSDQEWKILDPTAFKSNRQFIKLYQAFSQELKKHEEIFLGQQKYILQEKMNISAESILSISPDKVSLEVTNDGSIFYKILKDDMSIFFEHFLIEEFDGSDEAIISVYENDINILNFGGDLEEVVYELNKLFITQALEFAY